MSETRPRVAILDYQMGNLRSVQKALQLVGAQAWVASSPREARDADGVILPGVGAFGDAMANLRQADFVPLLLDVVESGTPLMGICVGLQVLFEESTEMGLHRGLGIIPGRVERFPSTLVVPHVGWNQIHIRRSHVLADGVPSGSHAYFTHSYFARPADENTVVATTDYGSHFASIVARDHVCGVQFHPEKSYRVGLNMLRNFVRSLGR